MVLCSSALCFSYTLHDSRCIEEYRMDGGYLLGQETERGWPGRVQRQGRLIHCISWGRTFKAWHLWHSPVPSHGKERAPVVGGRVAQEM